MQKAYPAINSLMIEADLQIGKRMVDQEQQGEKYAAWGEQVLKDISIALLQNLVGFSSSNLR